MARFKTRHWVFALLSAVFSVTAADAHSMYQSAVMLDFAGREIHAELQLPLERTEVALGQSVDSRSLNSVRTELTAYISTRFHAYTSNGSPFGVRLESPLTLERVDGAPYVVARLLLIAPNKGDGNRFDLEDDVLLDRIPYQVALVSIRSDWSSSVFANDPQLIGVINRDSRSVMIDRTAGSWFTGFGSIFRLGVRHIAEGTDHLLFLLALLLPAPLALSHSRWRSPAGVRESLIRILKVVTAFTIGHSITLALAALGIVHVPARPIEVLIAVSILVSAIHAIRPIFPGRESAIAGFFGLIHGLAFATTLGELGLGRWERVASIFAFNIGIETMQLIVVVATMPSLILLSRSRAYAALRVGGAVFAGLASAGWIAERLFDQHTPVDFVVDGLAHHADWIACLLLLVSIVVACVTALSAESSPYEFAAIKGRITGPSRPQQT